MSIKTAAKTVLIIDDDPMDINIFRSILESTYRLTIAINGTMGLRCARAMPYPDLILLDVMMPEMDGFEVCRRLKADPDLQEIPVIFVTGKDSVEYETKGFSFGAVDYIFKPFSADIVLARINTHLALRAATLKVERQNQFLLYEREVVETVLSKMRQSKQFDSSHIRFLFSPLEKASGDIVLSAFRPDGGQHILLGDFTGHGLSAAIGGPIVTEIFYSRTLAGDSLGVILAKVNQALCEKLPMDMFMAGCFVECAPTREEVRIWNCNIPDVILFRHGKPHRKISSSHRPLGILTKPYQEGSLLALTTTSDRIMLFSDGLVECKNAQGEAYGETRAEAMLEEVMATGEDLGNVDTRLQRFLEGKKQGDDITLVEISP